MAEPHMQNFGESPMPFTGQQELIIQYGLGDYSGIVAGLLDPTEQRLNAVAEMIFKNGDPEAGVGAMGELDRYYGESLAIGSVATGSYLMVVDGSLRRPQMEGLDLTELAFHNTHFALAYLRAVLEMPRDHGVLTRTRIHQDSGKMHALLGSLPSNALAASIGLAGGDALKRSVDKTEPSLKWGKDVHRAVGLLMRVAEAAIESPGTMSVAKMLGAVAKGSADEAVKKSREMSYFDVPQPVRHPRAPHVAREVAEVVTPEVDDSHGRQVFAEFGLQALTGKALKTHPIGGVLKNGGAVVLGKRYEFSGFGDNAGLAASFLDSLARIEDGKEHEALDALLDRVRRATEVASNGASKEMRLQLTSLVALIRKCTEVEFCQVVANHTTQVHPNTRRAVDRLAMLRERLQLSA